MGQRLVVDVNDGDRTLCKIHYHWSAYTVSAFEELATLADILAPLRDAYQSLTPDERRREVVATLARGLVARGGGINGTDEPITLTLQLPMFAGQTVKYYTDEAKKPGEIIPNSILKELKVNKKGEAKVTIQPMGGIILM